jgi:hypothetical protein
MTFYYQVTSPLTSDHLAPSQLFRVYRQACSGSDDPCLNQDVAWVDCPSCTPAAFGVVDGVQELQANAVLTQAQRIRFTQLGDENGVSQSVSP